MKVYAMHSYGKVITQVRPGPAQKVYDRLESPLSLTFRTYTHHTVRLDVSDKVRMLNLGSAVFTAIIANFKL